MKIISRKHKIDFIFPVVIFLVFALMALVVLSFGIKVYGDIAESSVRSQTSSTAAAYVTEKVHSAAGSDLVSVDQLDGCDALIIREGTDEDSLLTYIYVYDGKLKELYTKPSAGASAPFGSDIIELSRFTAAKDGNLLSISCTGPDGDEQNVTIALRTDAGRQVIQ